MKISGVFVAVAMLCILSSCGKTDTGGTPANGNAATSDADFLKFCEDLDVAKQTQVYVREHWKEIQNKEVTWSGKVADVRASRSTATVYIDKEERPTYKGYNVLLVISDMEAAGKLKKKDVIKFKGQLTKYRDCRGGIIIFTVESGEIL